MSKNCTFCHNEKVLERTVWRSDRVQIFPSNMPIVPGHLLVCPTRCVRTLDELSNLEQAALFDAITMIKPALTKTFDAEGFNIAWNEGVVAGQTVAHLHVHVLPRRPDDTGVAEAEPRAFLYRPGSRAASPQDELVLIAHEIQFALSD